MFLAKVDDELRRIRKLLLIGPVEMLPHGDLLLPSPHQRFTAAQLSQVAACGSTGGLTVLVISPPCCTVCFTQPRDDSQSFFFFYNFGYFFLWSENISSDTFAFLHRDSQEQNKQIPQFKGINCAIATLFPPLCVPPLTSSTLGAACEAFHTSSRKKQSQAEAAAAQSFPPVPPR